jgi:hypothetical protein
MSLSETVELLNREISATVERALSEMRRELSQRLRASSDDVTRHLESFSPELPGAFLAHEDFAPAAETLRAAAVREGRKDLVGGLRESFAAVDRARTQAEILGALLEGCCHFASRAALLLLRDGELHGWDGRGWHEAGPAIRDLTLQPPAHPEPGEHPAHSPSHSEAAAVAAQPDAAAVVAHPDAAAGPPPAGENASPWTQLSAGQRGFRLATADSALLCSRLESPLPQDAVLLPFVLRDRVAAALYADQLEGAELDVEALQLLTYVAAQAIETLSFRERSSTATLADIAAAGSAAPVSLPTPAEPHPAAAAGEEGFHEAPPAPAPEPPQPPTLQMPQPYLPARLAEASGQRAEQAEGIGSEEAAPAAVHSEGGTELAGPPGERPAFLDDSLYTSRHTTELPMPGEEPPTTEAGEPAWLQSPRSRREASLEMAAPAAPADAGGRNETVLLPRPGFRESVPPSWGRSTTPASEERLEEGGQEAAHGAGATAERPELAEQPTQPTPHLVPAPEPSETSEISETAQTAQIAATPATAPAPAATPDTEPGAAAESSPPAAGYQTTLTPVTPFPTPASTGEKARPFDGDATHPGVGRGAETAATVLPASGVYREPTTAGFEPLRSTPLTSGTPEVRPPSGVQGPGWAFATTRLATTSEESAHEEARRLARLLVSEIKLYNEEQVEAGRRNRDIYERLREDIDRSRQMYEERVEPRLAKSTDYFYQELVRILAAGDSKALGI